MERWTHEKCLKRGVRKMDEAAGETLTLTSQFLGATVSHNSQFMNSWGERCHDVRWANTFKQFFALLSSLSQGHFTAAPDVHRFFFYSILGTSDSGFRRWLSFWKWNALQLEPVAGEATISVQLRRPGKWAFGVSKRKRKSNNKPASQGWKKREKRKGRHKYNRQINNEAGIKKKEKKKEVERHILVKRRHANISPVPCDLSFFQAWQMRWHGRRKSKSKHPLWLTDWLTG